MLGKLDVIGKMVLKEGFEGGDGIVDFDAEEGWELAFNFACDTNNCSIENPYGTPSDRRIQSS